MPSHPGTEAARTAARLGAWLLLVVAARPADAGFVCDGLGPRLPHYGVVAEQLKGALGRGLDPDPRFRYGNTIAGRACITTASLKRVALYDWYGAGGIVATRSAKTAVKFPPASGTTDPSANYVEGPIITGGGSVVGEISPGDVQGPIDTSGADPAVADCNQALADARAASDAFAAMPPTRSLGSIDLLWDGNGDNIQAAPNEVIQIDSIRLAGAPYGLGGYYNYHYNSYISLCAYGGASLSISGGPAVVNVSRLDVGACAGIDTSSEILINVPGPGGSIRIAQGAYVPELLAPYRTVVVKGTIDDQITGFGRQWVRRLKLTGFSGENYYGMNCP